MQNMSSSITTGKKNRTSTYSRLVLFALLFIPFFVGIAQAQLNIIYRNSEIWFDGHSLGTDTTGSPPDEVNSSNSTTDPFQDALFGWVRSYIQPFGGHENRGRWVVAQKTVLNRRLIITRGVLHAKTEQVTGTGSPQINLESVLDVDFEVNRRTKIALTGDLLGGSSLGSDTYANVKIEEAGFPIFSSSSDDFPFTTDLMPGSTYTLNVKINGEARFGQTDPVTAMNEVALTTKPIVKTVSGVDINRARCINKTTGIEVRGTIFGDNQIDCRASGLVVRPGDRVVVRIEGTANGLEPVSGSLIGRLNPAGVICRNLDTSSPSTVRINLVGTPTTPFTRQWDCEANGLVVSLGDPIRIRTLGAVPVP